MILVDSSALIEYYRPAGSPTVRAAVAEVVDADLVAVNGVIQVEILGFASPRTSFEELLRHFKVFRWLHLQEEDFDFAAEIGFALRRKGITIPANDLIIAASAMRADVLLYHADSHYNTLSQHFALRAKNLRPE
jgi:predicted nucleic acid-binding protein